MSKAITVTAVIGLIFSIYFAVSKALDYMNLYNAVSPAIQGDYQNATTNVTYFLSDWLTSYVYWVLFVAIIAAIPCLAFLRKYLG